VYVYVCMYFVKFYVCDYWSRLASLLQLCTSYTYTGHLEHVYAT